MISDVVRDQVEGRDTALVAGGTRRAEELCRLRADVRRIDTGAGVGRNISPTAPRRGMQSQDREVTCDLPSVMATCLLNCPY